MKKVLFVATVDSHILHFHVPYLKLFKENGYEVHVATNGTEEIPYCDKKYTMPIERSPYNIKNLKAIKELKKIINNEQYEIIHCHTPMGSVVTRLAAKKARKKYHTRVIYTAHGFHFYKGAPLLNWLLFYPIEKWLAKYTDTLITINNEDYDLAKKKFSKRCKDIQYVPGVGVDSNKFDVKMTQKEKNDLRKSLGLTKDAFLLIFPAELNKNKNQIFLINAMEKIIESDNSIHLLLPGKDSYNEYYQKIVKQKGLEGNVHFLGYKKNIPQLLSISNIAVSSSFREGLPLNIIESLTLGLPIIALNCRGMNDLIVNGINGYIVNDEAEFINNLNYLKTHPSKIEHISKKNIKKSKKYQLNNIEKIMRKVYFKHEKNNIKLSIIIPVYNLEKYISRLINEIFMQKTDEVEIIIINDGSTDNTEDEIKKIDKKNEIKYFYQKNSGVSYARNQGLKKSVGKYIWFIDGDDLITENAIINILNCISEEKTIDIIQSYYMILENEKLKKNTDKIGIKLNDGNYNSLGLYSNVIRRDFLLNTKIESNNKLKYTEDMDLMLELLTRANNIYQLNQPIYIYCKGRSESATSKISLKRIQDLHYFISKWLNKDNTLYLSTNEINSFISYQYYIILGMVSIYKEDSIEFNQLKKDIINEKYIIKYCNNSKGKVVNMVYKLFGLKITMFLLGLWLKKK